MPPPRILHIADSHIGSQLPGRPRVVAPRRGDDLVSSYRRGLHRALEHGCQLVIHAGDVFDRPNPGSHAIAAAAEPLMRLAAAGVQVVIIPGNHERGQLPETLLLAHPNIHILATPRTVAFEVGDCRVAVTGFPNLCGGADRRFAETIEQTGWRRAEADVRVLVVHETFESATCGPGTFRFRSGDNVVKRDQIPPEFDYVAAGHIHRHQALATPGDGPPIVYAGSCDRVSFAELNESKGVVLLDLGRDLAWRFVEHAVRPMVLAPVDISGMSRDDVLDRLDELVDGLPPRAISQLRLTGTTRAGAFAGLSLSRRLRDRRLDCLITLTTQAIESTRAARPSRARKSAFDGLRAPPTATHGATTVEVAALPNVRGVYALHDAAGRLLYIGKAGQVRTRIRAHLRGKQEANFFSGWTRQIAAIEVRPAHSELECLLIEAELIRTLQPPFNRQMRRWRQYCYLGENGRPFGQLTIRREPGDDGEQHGPYRSQRFAAEVLEESAALFGVAHCPDEKPEAAALPLLSELSGGALCRRFYRGLCGGPCAGRVLSADYAARLQQRAGLLSGRDDAVLCELEQRADELIASEPETEETRVISRRARTLRMAFEQAALWRAAVVLVDGVIMMPGPDDTRVVAHFDHAGLRLFSLNDTRDIAKHVREACRPRRRDGPRRPRAAHADLYAAATRQLRAASDHYTLISAAELAALDVDGLWDARRVPLHSSSASLGVP